MKRYSGCLHLDCEKKSYEKFKNRQVHEPFIAIQRGSELLVYTFPKASLISLMKALPTSFSPVVLSPLIVHSAGSLKMIISPHISNNFSFVLVNIVLSVLRCCHTLSRFRSWHSASTSETTRKSQEFFSLIRNLGDFRRNYFSWSQSEAIFWRMARILPAVMAPMMRIPTRMATPIPEPPTPKARIMSI